MKISNKKVLVTGADGFIGSHLVEQLIIEGCEVTALAYYNSFNNWGWLESFTDEQLKAINVVTGDVRDPNLMRNLVREAEVVFHLAALIAIPYSYQAPDLYVDTNIKGTLNVLQAAREFEIDKTIITSTSEVYGTAQTVPISEDHPRQGQSPYSASKIGADSLAESFYRSFNLPMTIVRPFNTYGPRQSARAIIPTVITQLLNGNEEVMIGDDRPTRDFVYVKDTVSGFIEIAKSEELIGDECNIATNEEIGIGTLVNTIIELINPRAKMVQDPQRIRPPKSEVFRLIGDHEKITSKTNWKPSFDLKAGLSETIKWFQNDQNLAYYKSHIYNV